MIGKYWNQKDIKLIVGSGGTSQGGFISTDIDELDIRKWWHWARFFRNGTIKVVLAEHVFEHLTISEINKSFKLIHRYLSKGGKLRLAIPDKNRRDTKYANAVKPPNDGHITYFNLSEITKLLKNAGFDADPLEYFDDNGKFNHKPWSERDGKVSRSFKYDKQKEFKNGEYYYTSLLIDAIKK
jgi:predicted SAM-dependent methyltransferase